MDTDLTVEEKFTKARIVLLKGDPYIGKYLLLLNDPIECGGENSKNNYSVLEDVKTMATTGTKLYYNRKYVEKLSFEEFLFELLHQLLHCIALHPARGIGKHPKVWGMASDIWVNNRLMARQEDYKENRNISYKPPNNLLVSDDRRISDMSVDDIYAEFMEQYGEQKRSLQNRSIDRGNENKESSSSESGESLEGGDVDSNINIKSGSKTINLEQYNSDMISPENVGESSSDLDKKMSEMNASASVHAQLAGKSTGLLSEQEISMQRSTTKWYRYFDRFLKKTFNYETSYSTPEKSLLYTRRIYKGPMKSATDKLSPVIVAMDCSASIWSDKDAMEKFWFHINNIMKRYNADGRVLLWDGEVGTDLDISKFKPRESYTLPKGGTRPISVYEYIDENKIKHDVLVMLTDAKFQEKDLKLISKEDNKKTIWVLSGDHRSYKTLEKYIDKAKVCKL